MIVVYLLAKGFYYSDSFSEIYEKTVGNIGMLYVVLVPVLLGWCFFKRNGKEKDRERKAE